MSPLVRLWLLGHRARSAQAAAVARLDACLVLLGLAAIGLLL